MIYIRRQLHQESIFLIQPLMDNSWFWIPLNNDSLWIVNDGHTFLDMHLTPKLNNTIFVCLI